ncbi:alpha/beta fold hydrolase [Sphingomonas sp.]|uniref:alpha/beta fold hydrolase n=1 Tax=Sphingomonas sp. TaxID=28214 RepID=UPI003B00CCD3
MRPVRLEGAGISIAADVGGAEDGPLVVLQPGGGQTRHSWGKAGETLAERGYHVVSLDLRGHGDSDWSPDRLYGFDRYLDDLVRVLAQFADGPRYLVGASLGGIVSLLAVGENRVRADGLVLVDIAPKVEWSGASRIGEFMRARPEGFASVDEAADAVAAYLPHRPRPKSNTGLLKNLRLGADQRYRWHWDPQLIDEHASEAAVVQVGTRLEQAARALTIPTLLVRGGLSDVVSRSSVDHMREVVPHAEIVEVAHADHMIAGDRNDAFNTAVIEFLQRIAQRTPAAEGASDGRSP